MGEFDLSLISEFRSRPSFYDRSSLRFRDKLYNARQWQEISNKLGFDVSILKDRILQLRNRYNLEKRRIEQLREENPNKYYVSPWPLYEHLHFLANHIRARRSYKRMMPLNGNGGTGVGAGGHFAAGLELSNSCSNNSNLTLRHADGSGSASRSDGHNTMAAFPNGLLAVKMEDDSEGTEADSESQNNESEINAFETSGLIPETHSSPSLPVHQVQQQYSTNKKQLYPNISIRRLDSLKQDLADSTPSFYNKKQKLYRQPQPQQQHQQQQHQQQQQQQHQQQQHSQQRVLHHSSPFNLSSFQNDDSFAQPMQQQNLSARELKYTAFGNFISSSLLDLPPSSALELVEKFTSEIVKVLMQNAQEQQQKQQQQQQQEHQQQLLQQHQQQQQLEQQEEDFNDMEN